MESKKYLRDVKVILGELQHRLVAMDLVKKKVKKVVSKEVIERGKVWKLKEDDTRARFEGRATGPSEVSAEMIVASGEIGIGMIVELCQGVLDGRGMPDDWALSVVVPIFKGKGDAMKVVEKVLERRLRCMVKVDEMQVGFMPGKGTINAVFILRRLQEEYLDEEKKFYMCFVDLDKAFYRVPRKVLEWAMRKKGIPEVMVRAVMSLYEGVKTRIRVGLELSEELEVKVGVHQGSVVLLLVFVIVVDIVTENVRNGLMSEMLYLTWF